MIRVICFAFAVSLFLGLGYSGHAVANESESAQTPSSAPFEPQEYSPPLGGESCSSPAPIS